MPRERGSSSVGRALGSQPRGRGIVPRLPLSSVIIRLVIAAVLALVGAVWLLQGLGYLRGSVMTGDPTWAVIGTIFLMLAAGLVWTAFRRRK